MIPSITRVTLLSVVLVNSMSNTYLAGASKAAVCAAVNWIVTIPAVGSLKMDVVKGTLVLVDEYPNAILADTVYTLKSKALPKASYRVISELNVEPWSILRFAVAAIDVF